MSPHRGRYATRGRGFPRVSGDEPGATVSAPMYVGFSPRERGCAPEDVGGQLIGGVFPA